MTETTLRAEESAADAMMESRQSDAELKAARQRETEARAAAKASSAAAAEAREELGVLRLRYASDVEQAREALDASRRECAALSADAQMKAKALATNRR